MFRKGETVLGWGYVVASVAGGLVFAWVGERVSAALSA
jgi:fluoride ion exporter CrcB/FEX